MRIVEMVRDDIKNSSLLKTKFLIYAFNGRTQYKVVAFGLGKQTIVLDFIEGEDKYGLLSLNFLKGHSFILNYREKKLEILAPSL